MLQTILEFTKSLFTVPTAYAQAISTGAVTGETQSQLVGLVDFFIIKIPSFIAAFVVFVLFWLLAKAAKGIVENKVAARMEEHKEIQILAGRTASSVTLILGATISLNIAGIDLTVIIAAAGFGIGFALKDIMINFLAGIMILAQKHFSIGDFINVNGTIGKITEIQARATVLKALDGTKVVVPNADLFTNQVVSYTSNPFRRIEIPVGVEYSTDLNLAVQKCYDAMKITEGVLIEPAPVVLVQEFSDSSINLIVRAWVESRGGWLKIKSNLAINIKKVFDEAGISIPFPIRTIVYDKDAKAEKEEEMKRLGEQIKAEKEKEEQQAAQQPQPVQTTPQPEAQNNQQPTLQPAPVTIEPPVVKPQAETRPSADQPGTDFLQQS